MSEKHYSSFIKVGDYANGVVLFILSDVQSSQQGRILLIFSFFPKAVRIKATSIYSLQSFRISSMYRLDNLPSHHPFAISNPAYAKALTDVSSQQYEFIML